MCVEYLECLGLRICAAMRSAATHTRRAERGRLTSLALSSAAPLVRSLFAPRVRLILSLLPKQAARTHTHTASHSA